MSREADYGIVLLTRLAAAPADDIQNARALADDAQVTLPMVSKVLKQLTRDGILESTRGVNGGYRLARDAAEISVADVISAIDGPIALTVCIDHAPGSCEREGLCQVRDNVHVINQRIHETLDGMSIAEMARPLAGVASQPMVRRAST
jgi:FeS assembly SUF system regulator